MQDVRSLVTTYRILADGLKIRMPNGMTVVKDLYGKLNTTEPDSADVREKILQRVLDQVGGKVLNPKRIAVDLSSVVPISLANEETFELGDPLPSPRAKVVVRLPCPAGDMKAYDRCSALEKAIEDGLAGTGVGFVDGHDVGQGEFCIYCFGPRKKPLQDAVDRLYKEHLQAGER